jgi:hypothetical protein
MLLVSTTAILNAGSEEREVVRGGGGMVLSVASWRGSRASPLAKGDRRTHRCHHELQGEKMGAARI